MRTIIMFAVFLCLNACVQDEGKVSTDSVSDNGGTTGSTSGGTTGATTGGGGGTPTDPLYEYQWHLHNTGQNLGDYVSVPLASGVDINAHQVHENFTGEGVKIVISDSGTDYTHPDLSNNFVAADQRNYSFVDPVRWDGPNSDAYPSGNQPHGTAVAGIVAMEGWNDIGGRGVAPSAQYTAFKYILQYAAFDHLASNEDKEIHQLDAPYDIFNFSYGFNQCFFFANYDEDVKDAFEAGVTNLRGGKGAVYVQAAGNFFISGGCSGLPAFPLYFGNTSSTASLSYPEKILVAAVSADGFKSSYSTPGSALWVSGLGGEGLSDIDDDPSTPDEYAPAIFTADIQDCTSGYSFNSIFLRFANPFNHALDLDLNATCDYTNEMNGTSAATPMVSGVVALMLDANEDLNWREIKYILATTAQKVDFIDPSPLSEYGALSHPDGITTYGAYVYDYKWVKNDADRWFSNWYGFGLVDAQAAVAAADAWIPGSLGTYDKTETLGVWDHINTTDVPIPDGVLLQTPAESTITSVRSLTIEAVQVKLKLDHQVPGQLAVHLISPSGTVSRLQLVDSGVAWGTTSDEYYYQTNAFLDEDSGGDWKIEIYDLASLPDADTTETLNPGPDDINNSGDEATIVYPDNGTLLEWAINIHGH